MFHTSKKLEQIPYLTHGFFTKKGGVSKGIYESLNAGPGSDDNPQNINTNRERIRDALNPHAKLLSLYQIHSNKVALADNAWADDAKPQADAMVCKTPNMLTGILTADCGPILFAAKNTKLIASAHAGWKGAFTGVVQNTVDAMMLQGTSPDQIVACLGACIHQHSYEVDTAFLKRFTDENKTFDQFFIDSNKADHFLFDLAAFIFYQLKQAGITEMDHINHDTYTRDDEYFSYRRTCHKQEPDYGRQISVIGIK